MSNVSSSLWSTIIYLTVNMAFRLGNHLHLLADKQFAMYYVCLKLLLPKDPKQTNTFKKIMLSLSLFLCTLFPICCFITFFLFTTKKSLTFFILNIYQGFTHFNLVTNPFHHYYYYPATFNIILFHSLVSMCLGKKHLSSRTFI